MAATLIPTTIFSRNLSNHPLFSMQREMNKLFEDLVTDSPSNTSNKSFSPRIDVVEDEKNYSLTAELPGVEEKDIDISLKDGLLKIKAEKKSAFEANENGKHYSERAYGLFERSINLGDQINEDGIVATFKNGVLNLTIPKNEPTKPVEKKITLSNLN